MSLCMNLLPFATKLRRLCFTPFCHSVHRGVSAFWDTPPGPGTPPRLTATVADGTHPTGMHSCVGIFLL